MNQEGRRKVLVLGAFPPELEHIRKRYERDSLDWLAFHEIGIGVITAAAETSRLIHEYRIERISPIVLFVGSVGSVGPEDLNLRLISASSACFVDGARAYGKSYVPQGMFEKHRADARGLRVLLQAMERNSTAGEAADIYSTPSITSDIALGDLFRVTTAARFESLELFGVATACYKNNVPWNALCPVTNVVGPEGHDSWKEHHMTASEIVASFLSRDVLTQLYSTGAI